MEMIESTNDRNLLSKLRDLILIIAICCYFMGWIYAHYFYKHFGISLNSLDISFYYFFVYSYSVLFNINIILIFFSFII